MLELGEPQEFSKFFWKRRKLDLNSITTQKSIFDDPNTLAAFKTSPFYESRHRIDPFFRWIWVRNKKLFVK